MGARQVQALRGDLTFPADAFAQQAFPPEELFRCTGGRHTECAC
jgi:hypothetical protein